MPADLGGFVLDCAVQIGSRAPRTVGGECAFRGVGIHTGEESEIRILSAPPGSGIVFRRVDLPSYPTVPANVDFAVLTPRNTTLKSGVAEVATVEHLLATLKAFQVTNAVIEIDGPEVPIAGGDAQQFVNMLREVGAVEQDGEIPILGLDRPISFSEGRSHVVAIPSDEYRLSCTIHYPQVQAIRSQFFSFAMGREGFCEELAPCRTFALYEEVAPLMEAGLIKGGGLESAVVVKDEVILNKDGLRFPDEMVRHKILDLIGDLSLVGIEFYAHVIALCCGHRANLSLAKKIRTHYENS